MLDYDTYLPTLMCDFFLKLVTITQLFKKYKWAGQYKTENHGNHVRTMGTIYKYVLHKFTTNLRISSHILIYKSENHFGQPKFLWVFSYSLPIIINVGSLYQFYIYLRNMPYKKTMMANPNQKMDPLFQKINSIQYITTSVDKQRSCWGE